MYAFANFYRSVLEVRGVADYHRTAHGRELALSGTEQVCRAGADPDLGDRLTDDFVLDRGSDNRVSRCNPGIVELRGTSSLEPGSVTTARPHSHPRRIVRMLRPSLTWS